MQDIALLTDADDDEEGSDDKVSLMTIHAAKGLEFPAVHVVGLEENLFPSQMSVNSREDMEEERRLFYVAITRAEKKLTISFATSRYKWGNLISCEPSRFIEEIDPKFIDDSSLRSSRNTHSFEEMPFDRWERTPQASSSKPTMADIQQKLNNGTLKKLSKSSAVDTPVFEGHDTANLAVGMEVEHAKFGLGKVMLVEGNPGDLKATISFPGFGNKQLLLKFAKLRIVG